MPIPSIKDFKIKIGTKTSNFHLPLNNFLFIKMSFQNVNTKLFILGQLSELTKRKTILNRKAERIQEGKMWEEEALTKRKLCQRKKYLDNYA